MKKKILTFSPSRVRSHHISCPNYKSGRTNSVNNSISRNANANNTLGQEQLTGKTAKIEKSDLREERSSSQTSNVDNVSDKINCLYSSKSTKRSNVVFNECVVLHPQENKKNDLEKMLTEKMTQVGDGSIWQVVLKNKL